MDVGLHDRRVDTHSPPGRNALSLCYGHKLLVNPLDHLRPDHQSPATHRLGVRHLAAADPREVAVDQVGAHLALENLVTPVADMLEDQETQDHLGRRTSATATAALGMAPPKRFVNRRNDGFVIQQSVGVVHPALAQILHFPGDQSVAEAQLSSPHLNHGALSAFSLPPHPDAAVRD